MILNDMYLAIKELLVYLYTEAFKKTESNSGFFKNTATVLIISGLLVGSFYSFRFYSFKKESSAHQILQECVNEFENAKNGSASWHDVELAFDAGYNNNSGSKLAPFFLTFKAEALSEQGKLQDAIEVMSLAVKGMSEKDDLYGTYRAKLALMQLDSPQENVKKEGLEGLNLLAEKDNSGSVAALYYLGLYYFDKNDIENAKKYWQKLVSSDEDFRKKDDSGLPAKVTNYVSMAKEKLDQLN